MRIEGQAKLVFELLDELAVLVKGRKPESLVSDIGVYRGVERLVQLVVQAILDLGAMVIAALGLEKPSSYTEIGMVLRRSDALSVDEAEVLRGMAGLRNILVHAYAKADPSIVSDIAVNRLPQDAPKLVGKLINFAKRHSVDPGGDAKLASIFRKYGVKIALIFGSRAYGRPLKGDYDVAVYLDEKPKGYSVGNLQVELSEALGIHSEMLDLIILNSAPIELAVSALYGKPLYVEDASLLFKSRFEKLIEYLDLQYPLKLHGDYLTRRWLPLEQERGSPSSPASRHLADKVI